MWTRDAPMAAVPNTGKQIEALQAISNKAAVRRRCPTACSRWPTPRRRLLVVNRTPPPNPFRAPELAGRPTPTCGDPEPLGTRRSVRPCVSRRSDRANAGAVLMPDRRSPPKTHHQPASLHLKPSESRSTFSPAQSHRSQNTSPRERLRNGDPDPHGSVPILVARLNHQNGNATRPL